MNIVDSSGWLEFLTNSKNAETFAAALSDTQNLIVPSISVLEVFKKILAEKGEDAALQVAALMKQGKIIDLDLALALRAAKLGVELKLPLADSVILATARAH